MARVDLRVAAPAARILGGGCRLHERVAPIARLACSGGHRALASLGANGILQRSCRCELSCDPTLTMPPNALRLAPTGMRREPLAGRVVSRDCLLRKLAPFKKTRPLRSLHLWKRWELVIWEKLHLLARALADIIAFSISCIRRVDCRHHYGQGIRWYGT